MALKPDVSIPVALATVAVVHSIYQNATPSIADIRVARPRDNDIEASRKLAAWSAAGTVAAISLIARDPTVFIVGGATVILLDWWHRHANEVDPAFGKAVAPAMGNLPVDTQETAPEQFGYEDALAAVG